MTEEAYIERLRLCPLRPKGPLPRVSSRLLEIVRDHGVIEPIVVRRAGEHYEILSNVEGWMAAQQTQLDRVPIHILEGVSDTDAAEIVSAAFEGYSSNPIDEAEYFRSQAPENARGRSDHRSVGRLAFQTGHARPYISHALRLLRLPLAVQDMVRDGRLSAGHARALVTLERRSDQLALARRVVADGLAVREIEAEAKALRSGKSPARSRTATNPKLPTPDPDTRRLQTEVSERLGCTVTICPEEARLTIDYHNLDILDGVLAKLGVGNS